jgi:hypothetical protein
MSYSNKDFLIAKQFEMKEEVSFKYFVTISLMSV